MPSRFWIAGLDGRKKGLVASSCLMVVGKAGFPSSASVATCAARNCNAAFSGSTVSAKRQFLLVYSWPQYSLVPGGSLASFSSEDHIILASPSSSLPQPTENSVSPTQTIPSSGNR